MRETTKHRWQLTGACFFALLLLLSGCFMGGRTVWAAPTEAVAESGETAAETGEILGGTAEPVAEMQETQMEESPMKAVYQGYVHQSGWSSLKGDNQICTALAGEYMTGIKMSLSGQPAGMSGTISYQVNVSGSGWIPWAENFAETGNPEGEAPLEAVRVQLTGELAEQFDVYYKVLQSGSWTEWVKNGETAGVEGHGLRVDGWKAAITLKGAEPPEDTGMVNPDLPMVALTFDDGPNTSVTNRILDCLEANGGRATFFMVGSRVNGAADTVRRMTSLGCELGNHTYEHKYLTKLGDNGIRTSVGQTNAVIQAVSGTAPVLMRPTGGYYDQASLNTLGSMGMSAVMWSIDTLDWKHKNPQKTIDTVLSQVKDGDIILMHDLYGTTADAAEVLIPELKARGYQLVTVSEMAAARGGMAPGQVYSRFRP